MIGTLLALSLAVVGVSDGDTLTVQDGDVKTILRLAEIDAPERTQPYSQVSRRNLRHFVGTRGRSKSSRSIRIATDAPWRTYGAMGCMWNWRQIEEGFAWCFTRYLKHPETCLPLEKAARDAKRGLWHEPNPQPPWDFRAAMRPTQ